eukprot:jgi/Astpho2/2671/Aster-07018
MALQLPHFRHLARLLPARLCSAEQLLVRRSFAATAQPAEASAEDSPGKDPWDFQDDARRFVAAHRALKQGKLDRTEQLEAFINYKEAARAIAEKMSGGKIDWVEEEARARSTIKRSIVRMVRDDEDWENHPNRFKSPVTQQLWSDAIVEIEAEMGPRSRP